MLKGVLRLLLLKVIADGDDYGYALVGRLRDSGFADLAEGTVYPALIRLEATGLVTSYLKPSTSGPARKYYTLSEAGRDELSRGHESWAQFRTAVEAVLTEGMHR